MSNTIRRNLFMGLSGIQLPIPKYRFPPEFRHASRLVYYASFFNSIEVNSSFYKIPQKQTLLRWNSSVPENFTFTFKLYREFTHARSTAFDRTHITQFMEVISYMNHKRGCILIQFPPSAGHERFDQLEQILAAIEENDQARRWHVAVEFRNRNWYSDDTYDLLQAHSAAVVIHDMKASATPANFISSDFVYVRFHGPEGNYRGSYTPEFLLEYAEYIRDWLSEGRTAYIYFNNTAGDAFNNLMSLQKILA